MQLVEFVAQAKVREAGFFGDLTDGGLFERFARLNVSLGDGPAAEAVLDHQDFDMVALEAAKNHTAGGVLAGGADALGLITFVRPTLRLVSLLLVHRNHYYGK